MEVDDDAVAGALAGVGERLRTIRQRRGLRLADVAATTGVSTSTLSRLESGHRRPSLELLLPLARTYRVPLDDLVGAPETGDPRIYPRPVTRHGVVYIPLTRHADGVRAVKIVMPAARDAPFPQQRTHEGYEWLYVLTGSVEIRLGDRVTTVRAGEAAEFDTRTPHAFRGDRATATEILALFSPQGERVHVGGTEVDAGPADDQAS